MLVLYHAAHSTCSQKVRMVLHEKALQFDEVRIDLGKKEQLKPDYLAHQSERRGADPGG